MKILVTGSSGLLGSAIVRISSKRHEVVSVFSEHEPLYGHPFKLDLRDKESIDASIRGIGPDAIIHSAAFTDVDKCETERELATRLNVDATEAIAKSAARLGAFILLVSTDYVFDGERGNYEEDDKRNPINFYGETKLKAETAVEESDARFCIARTSTPFGKAGPNGKGNFALFVIDQLKKGKEARIVVDQFVSPSGTTNVAEMINELVERQLSGVFHVSGASRSGRMEFAKEIARMFELDESLLTPVTMSEMSWRARRPRDSSLGTRKAASTLDHVPSSLIQSLRALKAELEN